MPAIPTTLLIGLLLFATAAASDYLETRYVQAVGSRDALRAAGCSVAMWVVSVAGLIAVIEVGWTVLPFEALGLFVGTWLAMRGNSGWGLARTDPKTSK